MKWILSATGVYNYKNPPNELVPKVGCIVPALPTASKSSYLLFCIVDILRGLEGFCCLFLAGHSPVSTSLVLEFQTLATTLELTAALSCIFFLNNDVFFFFFSSIHNSYSSTE